MIIKTCEQRMLSLGVYRALEHYFDQRIDMLPAPSQMCRADYESQKVSFITHTVYTSAHLLILQRCHQHDCADLYKLVSV